MIKKRYILNFPPDRGDKAFTYHLVKDYDIRINILKAEVFPGKRGSLLLELQGKKDSIDSGVEYLKKNHIKCEPLDKRIHLNQDKCIDCGNCTAVCFAGSLTMNKKTWKLEFNKEKCVVCELCIPACPLNLFEIDFR
jgi:ferredoxin